MSLLAPKIDPSFFWPIAFFGLLHPVFMILNLLMMAVWIYKKKLSFVFNLAVLVLSLGSISKIFTLGATASPDRENKLRVISYNAKIFGVYGEKTFYKDFIGSIGKKNADILCIQEFYNLPMEGGNVLDEIKKNTGLKYFHFQNLITRGSKSRFGSIIFSRYKIMDYGELDFGKRSVNLCIYVDLLINDEIVRVYNVHLQSLKLARTDYDLLKRIGEDKDSTIKVSKSIFARLKDAYIKRGEQSKLLKESIKTCGKRVILCGDFNDTPQSFAYRTLSKNMKDAFIESGNGFGGTYVGPLPSLRIDYILHDVSMESYSYKASQMFFSDHKMVESLIDLGGKDKE